MVAGVALQDLEYFTETLLEDDRFLLLAPTLRVEMERRRVFSCSSGISMGSVSKSCAKSSRFLCMGSTTSCVQDQNG